MVDYSHLENKRYINLGENKTVIYGLYSTENNIIRYIGKANCPYSRFYSHLAEAKYTEIKTHKADWIRSVLKKGYELKYKILDICDLENWQIVEKEYIKNNKDILKLTNYSDGGEGTSIYDNLTYEEAKNVVSSIKEEIKNIKDYRKVSHLYKLPKKAEKVFFNRGWISWSDFLGIVIKSYNKSVLKDFYYTYDELYKICFENNINTHVKYKIYKKNVDNRFPKNPEMYYEKFEWKKLLNSDNTRAKNLKISNYLLYSDCKEWVKSNLNINTSYMWNKLDKSTLPLFIPSKPERVYKNDWISWNEFLGVITPIYLSYNEAKELIKTFNIKSNKEFRLFLKNENYPKNIPRDVSNYYSKSNEWISWMDFLGNDIKNLK